MWGAADKTVPASGFEQWKAKLAGKHSLAAAGTPSQGAASQRPPHAALIAKISVRCAPRRHTCTTLPNHTRERLSAQAPSPNAATWRPRLHGVCGSPTQSTTRPRPLHAADWLAFRPGQGVLQGKLRARQCVFAGTVPCD